MTQARKTQTGDGLKRPALLAVFAFVITILFCSKTTTAAELRSVQRGTVTMGTTGFVYVTLGTAIKDTTKAFLVFSVTSSNSDVCSKINVMGQMIGDDSLFFSRADKTNSSLNSIVWEVYEFTSGVSVQRGFANTTANPTNITLSTAVDLSKSFAIATIMRNGTAFGTDDAATAELTTSTNLAIRYGTTPVDSAAWQVIQYDDAFVQQVSTTLNAASSSTTGTIPVSVATGRSMVLSQYNINGDITAGELPRTELTNGTTITYTRAGNTTRAISMFAYVVQFNDSTTVQRGTASFSAGTGTVNVTLATPVDMARSAVMLPGHMGRGGSTNHTNQDSLGFNWFTGQLTTTTNLALVRGNSAVWTSDCPWQVVQFSKNEYENRTYSTRIQFNTTSTGANVATDQTNFPVLVRLDANNFLFSQADPNGADIRFADPDGSALKYEIERWDATNKAAEIWVRVPQVDGNSDRDYITMYWGNSSAQSASSSTAAFDTTYGFRGVWHLNAAFGDATAYANTGTNTGSVDAAGIIGRGRDFAAGSSQYVEMPYAANLNLSAYTFSAWTRIAVIGANRGIISSRFGGDNTFDAQWDSNNLHGDIGNGSSWLTANADYVNSATLAWSFVTWTATTNAWKVYLNGTLVGSNAYAGTPQFMKSGETLRIGQTSASGYFSGTIDEPRVENGVRSADWIKLSYESQRSNGKFLSFPNYALSTWNYNTKIYVNTSPTGANINSNLANYPLLVRLTSANFQFSQAQSTGADLRFADSTGAQLGYEIERFDAANKVAEIWVLVPTVYGNRSDQWIRMYWGKSTATTLSSGQSVFLTSNGWAGVWHLAEDGSTTSGAYKDATGYGNNGTGQNGMNSSSDVAGQVGVASTFTAASNHGIYASTSASLHPTNAMTIQAWVNSNSQTAYHRVAGRPFTSATSPWNEFDLEYDGSGTHMAYSLNLAGTEAGYSTMTTLNTGTWYMVTGSYDGAWQRIWLNGVLETGVARTGNLGDYSQTFSIGKYVHDNGSNFDGKIDEVRLSTVARSADWIKMDYQVMKTASTIVSLGQQPRDFTGSVRFNFNTTGITTTDVTNIPILVTLSSSNFDFTKTSSTGRDIQFIDKDGSSLYHEVAEWDSVNRSAKVWVKVPQVDAASSTDYITLYYGCPTCSASPYARADSVWNGYGYVYHLKGGETAANDATIYGNNGIYSQDMPMASGIVSPLAPYFDGTSNYIKLPNAAQMDGETATMSFWIKTTDKGDNATWYDSKWILDRDVGGTADDWALVLANATGKLRFSTRTAVLDGNVDISDGLWHRVDLVKTTTNKYIYVDGVQDVTAGNTDLISNDEDIYLMSEAGGADWAAGQLAEYSMYPSNRSADFIKLSYQNQKANSTLFSSTTISTSSFQSNKIYKLNTTASGANVANDVQNFPLLIRVTGSAICDAVQSGAPDVRFLYSDGVTWLDYQIERWDQSVDSAEIWVKMPVIHGNSASDYVTMYYQQAGGVTVPDGQCKTCVFSSYRSVMHLSQDPGGGAPQFVDASPTGDNGTAGGGASGDRVSAAMGKGYQLNGSSKYISTSTSAYSQQIFTNSIWFKTSTGSGGMLIGWDGGLTTPSGSHDRHIWMSNDGKLNAGTYNGGFQIISSAAAYNDGNWHQAVFRFSPAGSYLYVDGAVVASNANYNVAEATTGYWRAGNGTCDWSPTPTSSYFNGLIDDVKFNHNELSADWIKLEYQNQRRDAAPLFNPSPADFVSTRKYVFNTTKTGANVTSNVTNFPLLLRITGSTIVDAVNTNAPDIRFLDGDGKTWLNYQIERWDKTLDSAEVWVRVPQVDGNSDHDFVTLYYDDVTNGNVTDGQCGACVFDSTNGYQGVWHLNGAYTDATVNANNGTNNGTTAATNAAIGGAREFNGSSQYITVANAASLNPTGNVSLSAWIYADLWTGGNRRIIQKSTADDQYILKEESSQIEFYSRNSVDDYTRYASLPSTAAWHHLYGVFGGSYRKVYLDGAEVASETFSSGALNTTTGALDIGRKPSTGAAGDYFDGVIDEVRVENQARSADYVKLSYESQRRSGNVFWNSRPGPNNTATLTATAGYNNIELMWNSAVTDSANADSVGIWVKYAGYPDSAGVASTTRVVTLPKTDSAYDYPATYGATYYFALAVRNSSGQWSPFTSTSSDTANLANTVQPTDTVYVDSAIGNNSNTCTQARNPSTPKLTITSAMGCETNSVNDTLFVRVMPGTYTDVDLDPNSKPQVIASFDNKSRAVMNGSGSVSDGGTKYATVIMRNDLTLLNLDIKAGTNDYQGIYIYSSDARARIEGCRIYNNGNVKHHDGIQFRGNSNNFIHIANNLIHQPMNSGINIVADNSFLIQNNVLVGNATSGERGVYMTTAAAAADMLISNNIFYNWDYGISTASANIGVCSNNLFWLVTSGREVTGTSDAAKILKDPLFASVTATDRNGFKLLPGSPAIDAGTATYASGAQAVTTRSYFDRFGNPRPVGSAPDIGLYEGTGYAANPAGEFDSLTSSSTATTVTVENSKWKLIWDKARGGGISEFYDKTTNPATNLIASGTVLFDAKFDAYQASSQTSANIIPTFIDRSRTRVQVRQRLAVSASLDADIYYTIYASGHMYVESELINLSAGSATVGTVDYTLKLGTTTAAYTSAGTKNGFGYLTTSTRDAMISAITDLDGGASAAETWATSTASSGSPGYVVFNTTDLADLSRNTRRRHSFLVYFGDNSMDFTKAATLNADAYNPSVITASAGSLHLDRSWQIGLQGHWTMDDGAGTTARDKAVFVQNNAALTGANYKWVTGKVGGGLYLTGTDVATVTDNAVLEAANSMTVMFWIKPDFAGMGDTAYIISKGLTTADGWFARKVTAVNKILFTMGAATVTSPTLTDGVWTHIAVVAQSGGSKDLEMYVNGVMTSASTSAATATANASDLLFGYSAGGVAAAKFQGTLDDIRLFKNEISSYDIQSVYNRGFAARYGHYALRADNNNRVVALLNGGAVQTRVQPAFQITNWFGPRNPKYVYLNGVRLAANTDYVVDSIGTYIWGTTLLMQLNKVITGADQTLFVDDDDSTGFMGTAGTMKTLTITATANDKIVIKNFSDTVFGGPTSGQWYTEIDLNGWTTNTVQRVVDTGFGGFNVWKAAAIDPNVAVNSSTNLAAIDGSGGRSVVSMKFDNGATQMYGGGFGYLSPANLTYTVNDSSSTRLSLTLSNISLSGTVGTATLSKRWTIYPTGRIIGCWVLSSVSGSLGDPDLDIHGRYNSGTSYAFGQTYADQNARGAWYGGDLSFHSIVGGVLSVKNNNGTYTGDATTRDADMTSYNGNTGGQDYRRARLKMTTALYATGIGNITTNFFVDIGKDFTDSATADSMAKDLQTPATLTAITGSRITNDALDFNADNFAEGDGAYTYAASSGIAHFKYVNTVTSFSPAFRISSWTQGTLPEFVVVDNQVLNRGYQYNSYLNTGTNEVVIQFNKTLAPGTHLFFISHKTGLAVKLRAFDAKGGDGVDTLSWTTESEFENLGFHVWRRLARGEAQVDSSLAGNTAVAGAGIANALAGAARSEVAKRAAAKLAKAQAGDSSNADDTLPSLTLTPQELEALGYQRITARLVPGAKGGASAVTQDYRFLDRSAEFGALYEYLLEAVDFNGAKVQYGPRTARPSNPLTTELGSNYPNPFNPITTLRFSLKEKLAVSLIIYDARGRLVRTLVRPTKPMLAGKYRLIWDTRNDAGFEVPSGQYFYRFTAGRYVKTRKMILVK